MGRALIGGAGGSGSLTILTARPGLVENSLAAAHLPGSSFEVDVGAQKRRGFLKNPRRVLAWCRRCFLGVAPGVRPEPAQMCARNR